MCSSDLVEFAPIVIGVLLAPPTTISPLFAITEFPKEALTVFTETIVSEPVGKVKVPELFIEEMVGRVNVLFVKTSEVLFPTNVVVAFGKVTVTFALCEADSVVVVFAVPEEEKPILLVVSALFVTKVVESDSVLFVKTSEVLFPTRFVLETGKFTVIFAV